MQKQLKFSTNWNNKLDCQCYTTLRLSGDFQIGETVEVWHQKRFMHHGKIIDKKVINMDKINEWIAFIDTGYSRQECIQILRRMYKDITDEQWQSQNIYFYLIQAQKTPVTA